MYWFMLMLLLGETPSGKSDILNVYVAYLSWESIYPCMFFSF